MTTSRGGDSRNDAGPGTELRTHFLLGGSSNQGGATALSLWKGEVGLPDTLRIETRDGRIVELRLEPQGLLRVGRNKAGMAEPPQIADDLFISSQAAYLRHDGLRWWLRRRKECHEKVPTLVGSRVLGVDDEAPLVHGTFIQVGQARATLVDRRYIAPIVPAGAVDPLTGLLGRVGLEQELAGFFSMGKRGSLLLVCTHEAAASSNPTSPLEPSTFLRLVSRVHQLWPRWAIMHEAGTVVMIVPDETTALPDIEESIRSQVKNLGLPPVVVGHWTLSSTPNDTSAELDGAIQAARAALAAGAFDTALNLRASSPGTKPASERDIRALMQADKRRVVVLLGIEDTSQLERIGPHVVPQLEKELLAAALKVAGDSRAVIAPVAPGVLAALLPQGADLETFGSEVLRDWQTRPPIVDGKVEIPRALCWEPHHGDPTERARELSQECSDPHGVLTALARGLPYPIAGRVAIASSSSSAVERVKLLFDVLEGAWRLVAHTLTAAYLVSPPPADRPALGIDELVTFAKGTSTRAAYPLGKWRELARIVAKGLPDEADPVGQMARELLRVRTEGNSTLEALGNQLHPLRNRFAHNVYSEVQAQRDVAVFEQITRGVLRALRPLRSWHLVTIERTEPDLYGESQAVEFVDHTGPAESGTRRRIVLKSGIRLANVVYLVRWREGQVIPLEPFLRRRARGNALDLFWIHHLPKAGSCSFGAVVTGEETTLDVEDRHLPPKLRLVWEKASR